MQRRNLVLLLLSLMLTIPLVACGDDSGGGSAGTSGNNAQESGPANEIDAEISGGDMAGPVKGESEQSQQGQYFASVGQGEVVVFLTSPDTGVTNFKINTSKGQIPGSFAVGEDLDDAGYLVLTTTEATILQGTGGSIEIDKCPNEVGTVIYGEFKNVSLKNTITNGDAGSLSGSFRATVQQSDGSADCAPEPEPNSNNSGGGDSSFENTTSCTVDTCDGPCCPFLPALTACVTECFTATCSDPSKFIQCVECTAACEEPLKNDAACGPPYTAYGECAMNSGCEGDDPTSDECLAEACCSEFQAAF